VDAEKAAALQIALRRQGWQLETVDALVAITAERYRLILLTRDKDFTRVPGIRLEQWL
jgi:predicted nucleic acid-binding protein